MKKHMKLGNVILGMVLFILLILAGCTFPTEEEMGGGGFQSNRSGW